MAGSVRDLIMSVRVVDRATGPLRGIAGNVARLQAAGATGAANRIKSLESSNEASLQRQIRMRQKLRDLTDPGGAAQTAFAQRRADITERTARSTQRLATAENALAANTRRRAMIGPEVQNVQSNAARRRLEFQTRTNNQLQTLERRHAEAIARIQELPAKQGFVRQQAYVNALQAAETNRLQERHVRTLRQMQEEGRLEEEQQAQLAQQLKDAENRQKITRRRSILAEQKYQESIATSGIARGQHPDEIARRIQEVQTKAFRGPAGATADDTVRRVTKLRVEEQQLIEKGQQLALSRDAARRALDRQQFATAALTADERKAAVASEQLRAQILSQAEAHNANAIAINREKQALEIYNRQAEIAGRRETARRVRRAGTLVAGIGAAGTFAFGLMAKQAADIQTSLSLAATQARAPGAPVGRTTAIAGQLQGVVLKQMQEFPATAQEMSQSLYDIFSGTNVQNIDKASKLLRIFNMMAVAGGTDLNTMTQAGITLYNNFPKQFNNATSAGNAFFAMVRYGRGTAAQFAAALNPVIPMAKQAGLTFNDVAGTLATLSRSSQNVTQNAQGLRRLIQLILRPEVQKGFKQVYGIKVTDQSGNLRPLLDIFTQLSRHKLTASDAINFFKNISEKAAGRGTQGTIQAVTVFQRLFQNIKEYQNVSREVTQDTKMGEFLKSFAAQIKTPGQQFAIFKNQLQALAITLGTEAIPVFAAIGRHIKNMIDWFQRLSPHAKHLIGMWGTIISIGTLVGGVFLYIGGALAGLAFTLQMMAGKRGLLALAGEAGAVNPAFAVFLALATAVALLLYKYPGILGQVTNAFGGLAHAMEFVGLALALGTLGKMTGIFTRLGLVATESTGLIAGLRLSLLRLGAIGLITIGIMFIVDRKFRHQTENAVGEFNKGGFGFQRRFDDWATHIRYRLAKNTYGHLPFGLGKAMMPAAPPREGQMSPDGLQIYRNHRWAPYFSTPGAEGNRAGIGVMHPTQSRVLQRLAGLKQAADQFGITNITPKFEKLYDHLVKLRKAAEAWDAIVKRDPSAANVKKDIEAWGRFKTYFKSVQDIIGKDQAAALSKVFNNADAERKRHLAKMKTDFKSTTDSVHQMYQTLFQQNQGLMGDLFQGPMQGILQFRQQWGAKPTGGLLLKDLQGQVHQFSRFEGALTTLRKRGAPEALVQQLQKQGIQALPDVLALTRMSGGMWSSYVKEYNKSQKLIKNQTIKDLNAQLGLYKKFGGNVGKAIQQGIADESPGLTKEIRRLVLKMFPELKPTPGAAKAPAAGKGTTTHTHHHQHHPTTIHTGSNKEDVSTALAKHRNRIRNRPHYGGIGGKY